MTCKSTDAEGGTRDEPYRITFGKHRGLTIEELSPSYRQVLIRQVREGVYDNFPDLEAALIAGGFLHPVQSPTSQPVLPIRNLKALEQTVPSSFESSKRPALSVELSKEDATEHSEPVSLLRKRKASEQTMLSSSQFSKKPALLAGLGDEDATGKPQVTDHYILDFGKHAGKRLPNVPSRYIDWLINEEVYTNRPALATALRALGKLDTAPGPSLRDSTWKAPHVSEAQEQCFFDPYLDAPLWISDQDSASYFNLRGPTLASAGVYLISSAELDSYSESGSMFVKSGGHRRWLYPVFACAEHFNTAVPRTARQALQKFLDKNEKLETEMMDEFGSGM